MIFYKNIHRIKFQSIISITKGQKIFDYGLMVLGFLSNSILLFFTETEFLGAFTKDFLRTEVIIGIICIPIENAFFRLRNDTVGRETIITRLILYGPIFIYLFFILRINYNVIIYSFALGLIPRLSLRKAKKFKYLFAFTFFAICSQFFYLFYVKRNESLEDIIVDSLIIKSLIVSVPLAILLFVKFENEKPLKLISTKEYPWKYHLVTSTRLIPDLFINLVLIKNLSNYSAGLYKFTLDLIQYVKKLAAPIFIDKFVQIEPALYGIWLKQIRMKVIFLSICTFVIIEILTNIRFNMGIELISSLLILLVIARMNIRLFYDLLSIHSTFNLSRLIFLNLGLTITLVSVTWLKENGMLSLIIIIASQILYDLIMHHNNE